MVLKLVNATGLKSGSNFLIEGEPFCVKSIDTSKSGKHGASKCRIEATSLLGNKKKVLVVPGHERFDVPMVEKKNAQVLSVSEDNANMMDSESFENLDLTIPDELKGQISEGITIEYWDIEGTKIIKRII